MLNKKILVPWSSDFLEKLESYFSDWNFKSMGSIGNGNNNHYHISSKNKLETGILEITLSPVEDKNKIAISLKIADNRKGNWADKAMRQFEEFLYET